jgi:hypothetical protein
MTFPYNTNIPNPPNDPGDDVGPMQENTNTINAWVQVDHVGFNNPDGGRHNQVTFNSNNVPVPPVSPPILFTNTINSAQDGLFYYSGAAGKSSDQYVQTTNGSTYLLGGIILKWGTVTFAGAASDHKTATVLFGAAGDFPNNCFGVNACLNVASSATTTASNTIAIRSFSTSQFIYVYNSSSSSGSSLFPSFFWVAVGN